MDIAKVPETEAERDELLKKLEPGHVKRTYLLRCVSYDMKKHKPIPNPHEFAVSPAKFTDMDMYHLYGGKNNYVDDLQDETLYRLLGGVNPENDTLTKEQKVAIFGENIAAILNEGASEETDTDEPDPNNQVESVEILTEDDAEVVETANNKEEK